MGVRVGILEDIWSSIKGNARIRVKDPIIGTFIFSWCICNWDKLATLFLGTASIDERIKYMVDTMHITNLLYDVDLIILPLMLTILYLFVFPHLSLWVKQKQNAVILSQHKQAIELDINQAKAQKQLNKVRLRANPEKEFLTQEIEMDLQEEMRKSERRNKIMEYIDLKTKNKRAELEIKSSQAEKLRVELEVKKRQEDTEKMKFERQAAIHRATLASNRFPILYQWMNLLSNSIQQDGVTMSLSGLTNTIAAMFGYDTIDMLINDKNFNNSKLDEIKFIYHDSVYLADKLSNIASAENDNEEIISGELLFDHVQMILEGFNIDLLSADELAEKICDMVNETSYDILNSEELSGPMAETDTIFDDLEIAVDSFKFNDGFEVSMSGYASGHHRKEDDVIGRELSVNIIASCTPKIGRFGLSDYKLTISGSPRDYE